MLRKPHLLLVVAAITFGGAVAAGKASASDWEDIWAPYLRRDDRITTSSGNAQAANTAIMTINRSPRSARNRHIPGNGARMTHVIEAYQNAGSVGNTAAQPASSPNGGASSGTSGGGSTNGQNSQSGQSGQQGQ